MLLGWVWHLPALASLAPGWISMTANAALAFVLSSVALFIAAEGTPRAGPGPSSWHSAR